jgi:GNAT superfamily N-acetyltransferase
MPSLAIRPAALEDSTAILEVLDDARQRLASRKIAQWEQPFEISFINSALQRSEFFIATFDQHLAGVLRLLWSDPEIWGDTTDSAYVHTLAVHRDFLGQGFGYRLLNWCETTASARGCRYLRLDCPSFNSVLRSYYTNYGFVLRAEKAFKTFHVALFEKAIRPVHP